VNIEMRIDLPFVTNVFGGYFISGGKKKLFISLNFRFSKQIA